MPRHHNPAPAHADTGRKNLTRSVLGSWTANLVYIVAGFLMPRVIDRHLGQTLLGIWDFSWSIVTYLRLGQLGVGSSIDRYVSRYRAQGDVASLNKAASSVMAVQLVTALVTAAAAVGLALAVPVLFGDRLGDQTAAASWVVALLGVSVAIDMGFDVFRGVITGCHRWTLHNTIDASSYAVSVATMLVVLALGGGLQHIAFAYLCGNALMQFARSMGAYHVCPELRLRAADASWPVARKMLAFGMKGLLHKWSRLVLLQANAILVTWVLGPAALAIYSRPVALVRHIETFVNKLSFVLTPTVSSLQVAGREQELRELLITSTRYTVALTLPSLLFLGVLGNQILQLWMGQHYERGDVLAIVAAGYFLALVQQPAASVLRGLNRHGQVAVVGVISAVVGIILSVMFVGIWDLGLTGAALAIALPLTLGSGVFIALNACRSLGIPLVEYARGVFTLPALCCLPFAFALFAIRTLPSLSAAKMLALGAVAAGCLLVPLYWRFLLPASIKRRIQRTVGGVFQPDDQSAVAASGRGSSLR